MPDDMLDLGEAMLRASAEQGQLLHRGKDPGAAYRYREPAIAGPGAVFGAQDRPQFCRWRVEEARAQRGAVVDPGTGAQPGSDVGGSWRRNARGLGFLAEARMHVCAGVLYCKSNGGGGFSGLDRGVGAVLLGSVSVSSASIQASFRRHSMIVN